MLYSVNHTVSHSRLTGDGNFVHTKICENIGNWEYGNTVPVARVFIPFLDVPASRELKTDLIVPSVASSLKVPSPKQSTSTNVLFSMSAEISFLLQH